MPKKLDLTFCLFLKHEFLDALISVAHVFKTATACERGYWFSPEEANRFFQANEDRAPFMEAEQALFAKSQYIFMQTNLTWFGIALVMFGLLSADDPNIK